MNEVILNTPWELIDVLPSPPETTEKLPPETVSAETDYLPGPSPTTNPSEIDTELVEPDSRSNRNHGRVNFPLVGGGSIPMALLRPYAAQATSNHNGKTLDGLARMGGLTPQEVYCIIKGVKGKILDEWTCRQAIAELATLPNSPPKKRRAGVTSSSAWAKRAVIGTNMETGEVKRFEGIAGTKALGFDDSSVSACCKGKRRFHKGWTWVYADVR